MEVERYAPVIIPTLCRYEHFRRCVDSLSKCTGANKTKLIIGIDYPLKEAHKEGYKKICNYVLDIAGFKEVIVIKREYNYGAAANWRSLVQLAYSIDDRYIGTEDDNEFSPNFLEYINKGLMKYENTPNVMAICGYSYLYDIKEVNHNAFMGENFSAWGVGCWKAKQFKYQIVGSGNYVESILASFKTCWLVYKNNPIWFNNLLGMHFSKAENGDSLSVVECLLDEKVSIFPKLSKVRNWGNDGTGEHCKKVKQEITSQIIDNGVSFDFDNDIEKQNVIKFARYMGIGVHKWVAVAFRYLFLKLFNRDILFFYK